MSKSERQSVRDEIYDHLMCRYETNLAVGTDEEEAAKRAVEDLGDAPTLRFKLGQVHSYAPKPTLKKAMNLMICGYVLTSFHISLFDGMKEITTFIGTVCFIVALFCFRTSNKKMKAAFYLKSLSAVLSWTLYAVDPIYSLPFAFSAAFGLISNILNPVYIILVLLGLKELVMPHLNSYPKKIPFDAGVLLNGLWGLINIILYVLLIDSGELNANLESIFLFALIMISVILNLFILFRSSKLLWNSDHEYKIENSPAKKAVAALLCFAVAVVPTVAVDIFLANQKAETSVHTIEDYEMPQSEYERITSNLLSYDIPEKIVYNLPKSEIIKYSACVNKSDYPPEKLQYLQYTVSTIYEMLSENVEIRVSSCAIGMLDEDGYPLIRVLSWVDYVCGGKVYDDAFFWDYPSDFYPLNYQGEYNESFLLILSEENGKTVKNEPLDIYVDKDALTDRMTGVRFECKNSLTVIHSENFALNNQLRAYESNLILNFCHRNSPVMLKYRDPITFKENNIYWNTVGYRLRCIRSRIVWEYYGYEKEVIQ